MNQEYPIIERTREDDSGVRLDLKIPHDLVYFQGHLPGFPLLPGVVQLNWAVYFAKQFFSIPHSLKSMNRLRFAKAIFPGATIRLEISYNQEKKKLKYTYIKDQKNCSSGELSFV